MEKEKQSINTNEVSLEKRDCSKEYWYLNQLKWKLDFGFYKNPVLCESNFYSSIAWYIDTLQKEYGDREVKLQDFINSIINFNGSDSDKLLYADKILIKEKQKWYDKNNMDYDKKLLDEILTSIDNMYKKWNGHVLTVTWVKSFMIPEWYNWRFTESWLEAKVVWENRKNIAAAMRHWMEKAEQLKGQL